MLVAGTDPARAPAEQERQARLAERNTVEHMARDWHRTMIKKWQPRTAEEILRRFESDLFPAFGHLPIAEVQAPDVLDAIRTVERRGALEIANRQTANRSRVFKHAIRCGLAERTPAEFLRALYANEACMGVRTAACPRPTSATWVNASCTNASALM